MTTVHGRTAAGFEPVREAFAENFARRDECGAACCVYVRGERVVDLWGGLRNKATGEPWEEDTMACVFSTTKGMAGLALAHAHSRGWLDYDARVAGYWPEFASAGKESVTVRQLISHQAGLYAVPGTGDRRVVADPDRLAGILARQAPEWPPGERQAYHAVTLGYYEGELLRRADPRHRTLGRYFQDELATPLGLDFYIRLPEEIPNARLAVLERANPLRAVRTMPLPLFLASLHPRSRIRRALEGSLLVLDPERVYSRNLEIPAGGGVGTARAIARAYGAFATGGRELGLREETLRALAAPPVAPAQGFRDAALKVDVRFSLGFAKPSPGDPFGSPAAFGMPGAGGSFGFADPEAGIGYGYVPNRMGTHLVDPRDAALREALRRALAARPASPSLQPAT